MCVFVGSLACLLACFLPPSLSNLPVVVLQEGVGDEEGLVQAGRGRGGQVAVVGGGAACSGVGGKSMGVWGVNGGVGCGVGFLLKGVVVVYTHTHTHIYVYTHIFIYI